LHSRPRANIVAVARVLRASTHAMASNPFRAQATLSVGGRTYTYFRLGALHEQGVADLSKLPYSIRVLLEAALRNWDGFIVEDKDVRAIAQWQPKGLAEVEIPFMPGRVVLQDFTGVPCVVDLAAMRAAMRRLGGEPKKINPLVPCDLVIDHSVQVDFFGSDDALSKNLDLEFARNRERYEFLKWGQQSLANFRVVPPGTGIVHQVNLEYLAEVVLHKKTGSDVTLFPDSCVGTDSHTTMINGLGVVGWGVGGIEAEAVMLGQPTYMLLPEVIGFELTGKLPAGATATDVVLTATEMLRKRGVVNKFVEFYGDGARGMSLADRATIANMAPEYGATMGYFPVDDETLRYLRETGRSDGHVELVRAYFTAQGLLANAGAPVPEFSDTLRLDLATVVPSLAGPKRPQDRVPLANVAGAFRQSLQAPLDKRGFALTEGDLGKRAPFTPTMGAPTTLGHGAVVIAAITSCTNTSNPSVMLAAGLLARNAVRKGLKVQPWVKTSLAPGSRVVTDYLTKAGVLSDLAKVGFQVVGYGCTTCIGNSGPLPDHVAKPVREGKLIAAAVLSGNRNFEGRVNPDVKANYLASPPLCVAYALAGRVDLDLTKEPLGKGGDGKDVYLRDIWPADDDVRTAMASSLSAAAFRREYGTLQGPDAWRAIEVTGSDLYTFNPESTYIQEPPFFLTMTKAVSAISSVRGARVLALLGDSVTTDHISPAGNIKADSPAGRFLQRHGVAPLDFNSYGARRGNDRVMTRGTFANIQLRNLLAPGTEGGVTRYLPTDEKMAIFDAAEKYAATKTPLVVLAGLEYGTGSSRDWAAKGVMLLGVKVVIAESFERIHRSNLVGMGVLPLQFKNGESPNALGLSGEEVFDIEVPADVKPRSTITVRATDGKTKKVTTFTTTCRIDTPVEVEYYKNGGILQTVLRKLLR
jgi:aconitate hydratase